MKVIINPNRAYGTDTVKKLEFTLAIYMLYLITSNVFSLSEIFFFCFNHNKYNFDKMGLVYNRQITDTNTEKDKQNSLLPAK